MRTAPWAFWSFWSFFLPCWGSKCQGFRTDFCQDPESQCQTSSHEHCQCAEGHFPQIDGLKEQGVHFGCCPGHGIIACGPQAASIRTFAQVFLSQSLMCIVLTTWVIHKRQRKASRIEPGDSEIEASPQVHDGAQLHAEVPIERWCVSLADLKQFKRLVGQAVTHGRIKPTERDAFDPKDQTIGPSMYTVTEQYIKPVTAAAGNVSWALMKNPDGLPCDVFITHAWAEGIYEFVDKVVETWPPGGRAAYVCFLSNPQNLDIAHLISTPEESPFAKALGSCKHVLAVPNRTCSIYSRLWCVYEAFLAYTSNKPITNATSCDINTWAYLLRIVGISQASLSAALLLPLRFAVMLSVPFTILVPVPFMVLFLLSFGRCGGYKPLLQNLGVLGVTLTANVGYGCAIITGRALFEHNWLFALQYISLGFFGTLGMELDRLNSVSADAAALNLRRGFTGRLSDADCSTEADRRKILEQVKKSGHEKDVEEAVKVLMKMNLSTPELRATAERTGTLTDASHWSRAILSATFIAFPGFRPFILLKYGHLVFGIEYGHWFQGLLIIISTYEAVVFLALFIVLPDDRKAFAARVQSLWLVLWPVHALGGSNNRWFHTVSVLVYCPLLLAISIMGPASTAQIPYVGPHFVRLVFGKPRCLRRCARGARRKATSSPEGGSIPEKEKAEDLPMV